MLTRRIATLVGACAISSITSMASAATMIVDSQTEFDTEVGAVVIQEELFLTNIPAATTITFDSGVSSTAVGGNPVAFGDNSVIRDTAFGDGDGEWFSAVGPTGVAPTSLTWTFPTSITGFFGSFESATFVRMEVLTATDAVLAAFNIDTIIPPGPQGSDGFLGVVDTAMPFNRLRFTAKAGTNFEIFSINSFQFTDGTPVPPAVPLPAGIWMLFAAMLPIGLLARRRA